MTTTCKQVTVIGNRPTQAPDGWSIFNAPRPLCGDTQWTGDFVHGIFYVAVDPADDYAAGFIACNANLDAWQLEYTTEEVAVTEMLSEYQATYPDEVNEIDPADPEHRQWLLDCFWDKQRG